MSRKLMNIRAQSFILADPSTIGDLIKVELLRTGSFKDSRYGKFEVTKKMLDEMVGNFNREVRGIKPALDYSHKSDGVAAGWFKKIWVESKDGGHSLMAEISPTPTAAKMLADKEFGYISADFDENYIDNETNEKYGCVLLGAGLTNRPVIKRMESVVQLSEKNDNANPNEGDRPMLTPEQEKKLGAYDKMAEGMKCADPDALYEMVMALQKKVADLEAAGGAPKEMAEMKRQLTEANSKLEVLNREKATAAKTSEFNKLLAEHKAVEGQREAFMAGDAKKFAELAQPLNTKPSGQGGSGGGSQEDPQDEVLSRAKTLSESEKIPMRDAISRVLAEDPELAAKTRK